ncbi:MAG: hypothetical protein WBA74_03430 [Cyclobacteriaceae bacterium]
MGSIKNLQRLRKTTDFSIHCDDTDPEKQTGNACNFCRRIDDPVNLELDGGEYYSDPIFAVYLFSSFLLSLQ